MLSLGHSSVYQSTDFHNFAEKKFHTESRGSCGGKYMKGGEAKTQVFSYFSIQKHNVTK